MAKAVAGVVMTLLLAGCGAGGPAPRLRVATGFQTLTVEDAYTETPYHVGLGVVEPVTDTPVTLTGVRFAEDSGVRSVTGWVTDLDKPGAVNIGSDIGDLAVRAPGNTFVHMPAATVAPGDGARWLLGVTVVPGRTGSLTATDAVVSYRDAKGHTGDLRVTFALTLDVRHTGVDPEGSKPGS